MKKLKLREVAVLTEKKKKKRKVVRFSKPVLPDSKDFEWILFPLNLAVSPENYVRKYIFT